jgi:hypothetical protein
VGDNGVPMLIVMMMLMLMPMLMQLLMVMMPLQRETNDGGMFDEQRNKKRIFADDVFHLQQTVTCDV